MDEWDVEQEEEWPNDDEANDVMLAYAPTDDSHDSESGCAGVVLILIVPLIGLFYFYS